MKLRAYYFVIAVIAISGLLTSIAFFPSASDTPLMYVYDKQYEKAYPLYKELYDKGDKSMGVAIPLAKILLASAREEEAIVIMEEYVDRHPQSIDALLLLGKIYLQAHHSYAYLRNTETLYGIKPTPDLLREKEKYYGYVGDTTREIESLEEIVNRYKPLPEEYLELAYRYASTEQTNKALQILRKFLQRYPIKTVKPEAAEFTVDILAAQGMPEEAFTFARRYQKAHPDPEITLRLVSALSKQKLYKEGRWLLDHMDAKSKSTPRVIIARSNLLMEAGNNFVAYEYLLNHYVSKTLPRPLIKELLLLAVEYNDMTTLEHMVRGEIIHQLPDDALIKILRSAVVAARPDVIEKLAAVLDNTYLVEHPPVAMALMLVDSSLSDQERSFLSLFYDTNAFSPADTIALAQICSSFRYRQTAQQLLGQITTFAEVSNNEIDLFTRLLWDNGLAEEGWEIAQEALSTHPNNAGYVRAWVLLGSAIGETDAIVQWVKRQKIPDELLLKDAFDLAYEGRHASLSLHLAQTLFGTNPSTQSRVLLGKAWLLNDHTEKAYLLLKSLQDQGEKVTDLVAQALIVLAAKDPQYEVRLTAFIQEVLHRGKFPAATLRNLGYLLINNKNEAEAEQIFQRLAKESSFDDPDQQTLLGLWGAQLGAAQLEWITERSLASTGSEKGQWLKHLLDTEHYDELLPLVEREEWGEEAIVDIYVQALMMAKEKETLEEVIAYVIPQEGRLPRLNQYGKIAREQGLTSIATTVYLKILEQAPGDEGALLSLGGLYYFDGQINLAKKYTEEYFAGGQQSHLADYYYGEILLTEKEKKHARPYFQQGLSKIEAMESPDSYTRAIEAHFLYRLGYMKSALARYAKLVKEVPKNLYLRADLANVLMDVENLNRAKKVLFTATTPSEDEKAEIALAIAKARYFKECMSYKHALAFSNELMKKYPDSATVLASRADLEFTLKRWRRSAEYIDAARVLAPKDERLYLTRREILLDHQPLFALEGEVRKTGDNQLETFFRHHSTTSLGPGTLLSFKAERDRLRLKPLDLTKTYERCWGEVALEHTCMNGDTNLGALYFSPNVFGGGVQLDLLDGRGKIAILLEYHRPNWDFTQTIIRYGSRDMVGISRILHVAKRLDASLGVALNRYNLHDFNNATASYAIEGQVTWTLWPQSSPVEPFGHDFVANLNYSLDAEHKTHSRKKLDPFGLPFEPLALADREVQVLSLLVSKRLFPYLAIDAYGGYSYDRTIGGKCVPVYGGNLILWKKECLEGRLTYSHSTSTQNLAENVDRYIFNLTYRWGS